MDGRRLTLALKRRLKMNQKSKKAVLISDVHLSIPTLDVASKAMYAAINYAHDNGLPLIVAGDLLDQKALIRGEVANKIIHILTYASEEKVSVKILVGNHDLINELSLEHSLNFLKPYAQVIDEVTFDDDLKIWFIPYQSSNTKFENLLYSLPNNAHTIICHQGLKTSHMGEYITDRSSTDPEVLAGYRIISGHYHRKQDISLPELGLWSYIGTPYTVTSAEFNDGSKGFCVLYSDGSLEQVPTSLRKHVIVQRTPDTILGEIPDLNSQDILCIKVSGLYSDLEKLDKKIIGLKHLGHSNFKLDLIPIDAALVNNTFENMTDADIIDSAIDTSNEKDVNKQYLKILWREVLGEARQTNNKKLPVL